MRLNKHISDTGYCSRREADRLIAEGRVTVNGLRARVGAEVGEGDEVLVDGQKLQARTAGQGPAQARLHRAEQAGRASPARPNPRSRTTSSTSSATRSASSRSAAWTRTPKA